MRAFRSLAASLFWNLYAQVYDALPRHFGPYIKHLAQVQERRRRVRNGDGAEGLPCTVLPAQDGAAPFEGRILHADADGRILVRSPVRLAPDGLAAIRTPDVRGIHGAVLQGKIIGLRESARAAGWILTIHIGPQRGSRRTLAALAEAVRERSGPESRRRGVRIRCDIPATAQGPEPDGTIWKGKGRIRDFSLGGLSLHLASEKMPPRQVVVRLSDVASDLRVAPVAAEVLSGEKTAAGQWLLRLRFTAQTEAVSQFVVVLEELARPEAGRALTVLDAGCGTGNYVLEFARQGDFVVGLDSAAFMLRRGARKAQRQGLSAAWCRASLDALLPFRDGAFDHLVSVNALYMLRDPRAALREFHRVLKPGGKAWVSHPSRMPSFLEILAEQRRQVGLLKTARLSVSLLLVGLFNVVIARRFRGGEYFFWSAGTLVAEIEAAGFEVQEAAPAYIAGANTLVQAIKP